MLPAQQSAVNSLSFYALRLSLVIALFENSCAFAKLSKP